MTATNGPRPDLELLAELDAGLLDARRAAEVRAAAIADPASAAVLDAFAATRAELAALPAPPVPAAVHRRWVAALDAEAARVDPLPGTSDADPVDRAARTPRIRRRYRGAGPEPRRGRAPRPYPGLRPRAALTTAALLALLAAAGLVSSRPGTPPVDRVDLAGAGHAALGTTDAGDLADPARRAGCLRAVEAPGVAPDALLLGGRRVELDGRAGVLLVLATGERGVFHTVVVDPGCGPDGGTLLGATVVGR